MRDSVEKNPDGDGIERISNADELRIFICGIGAKRRLEHGTGYVIHLVTCETRLTCTVFGDTSNQGSIPILKSVVCGVGNRT